MCVCGGKYDGRGRGKKLEVKRTLIDVVKEEKKIYQNIYNSFFSFTYAFIL